MPLYVVAYGLKAKKGETRNYQPLEDALGKLDAVHTLKTVWYVSRKGTAAELHKLLKPKIRADDRLMIVEFSKKPAWQRGMNGTKGWIDKKFPAAKLLTP